MRVEHAGVLPFVLLAALSTGTGIRAQTIVSPTAEAEIEAAPVELDGVVLFRVRGVSSLPSNERARRIQHQLVTFAADQSLAIDSLRLVDGNGATRVMAGDLPLMTIVDADADLEQIRRVELASAHLDRIRRAALEYRQARSPTARRRALVNVLLAAAIVVLGIATLAWVGRRVDPLVARRLRPRIQSVGIQSFEVMRAEQIWSSLRSALIGLRMLATLGITLVFVGYLLSQFPSTRYLSRNMVDFALVPLRIMTSGLIASIPSLVFLAVLFVVVRLGLRLVRLFFDAVRRGTVRLERFDPEWAEPTYKLIRLAIVGFALIVSYPYIPGSDTAAFRGVSLFIGIVFSLGSSAAIGNIIAGYMMTYRRALKVGDRVKIGDAIGDVIETRLQVTHLRSFKNEEIIVPNSQILAAEILNYSSLAREHGLILHTEVAIGYDTPWRQVEAMLLAAAERTEGIASEPRPFVHEKRLGDFSVTYELNAYCSDVKAMNQLYASLHRNILDIFNEHAVQIMTPAYEGDPPEPKVVPPAKWYTAPAVRPTTTAERRRSSVDVTNLRN